MEIMEIHVIEQTPQYLCVLIDVLLMWGNITYRLLHKNIYIYKLSCHDNLESEVKIDHLCMYFILNSYLRL